MILETLAGIHEGFRNAQLISPDQDLPKSFRDLQPEELNTVARIFEVTSWLQDFCEAAEEDHDDDHISPYRTICIRCIESANLPTPPAHITDIMLTNALETRALRETLRNEAIRKAINDINEWREAQTEAMKNDLVTCITSPVSDLETLARNVGNLDPHITEWVTSIHGPLRKAAIQTVMKEAMEDCMIPHARELLESEWTRRQTEIEQEIRDRSTKYDTKLRLLAETFIQQREQELRDSSDQRLSEIKAQLEDKLADDIAKLKNQMKASLQTAKDEAETRALTLAVRTPKAAKPSPLSLTRPKKAKKKKITILDLTTPPPQDDGSLSADHTDMEMEADSTPTTPVCRSSAPSPPLLKKSPSLQRTPKPSRTGSGPPLQRIAPPMHPLLPTLPHLRPRSLPTVSRPSWRPLTV